MLSALFKTFKVMLPLYTASLRLFKRTSNALVDFRYLFPPRMISTALSLSDQITLVWLSEAPSGRRAERGRLLLLLLHTT